MAIYTKNKLITSPSYDFSLTNFCRSDNGMQKTQTIRSNELILNCFSPGQELGIKEELSL
jgi:hypothetical protein